MDDGVKLRLDSPRPSTQHFALYRLSHENAYNCKDDTYRRISLHSSFWRQALYLHIKYSYTYRKIIVAHSILNRWKYTLGHLETLITSKSNGLLVIVCVNRYCQRVETQYPLQSCSEIWIKHLPSSCLWRATTKSITIIIDRLVECVRDKPESYLHGLRAYSDFWACEHQSNNIVSMTFSIAMNRRSNFNTLKAGRIMYVFVSVRSWCMIGRRYYYLIQVSVGRLAAPALNGSSDKLVNLPIIRATCARTISGGRWHSWQFRIHLTSLS